MSATQKHLDKNTAVNLGSFYTPQMLVSKAYGLLQRHAPNLAQYTFLDTSCGYGDFFTHELNYIGADIDELALKRVQKAKTIHTNSITSVCRAKFSIANDEKIIIIGNPPYNDKTSQLQAHIKKDIFECDKALTHRDLGISFLRSYELLHPEFVCVLHPLSYLIKKANFKALQKFKENYKLIDGLIISSRFFTPNSSGFFPIIIALYQKMRAEWTLNLSKTTTLRLLKGSAFA